MSLRWRAGYRGARPSQRLGVAARERLQGLRERKLQLLSLEQAAPEKTTGRLIPSGEAGLSRSRRLQIARSHLELCGQPAQAETGLFQEVRQVKPSHFSFP